MSLEALLQPAKWVDKRVQKQFTKFGERIPEKKLYKITMGAQWVGKIGTATWGRYIGSPEVISIVSGVVLDGPDFLYNLAGLQGRIQKDSDGETISIDPTLDFCERYNKAIRLPVFLTSVGFLGKVAYDVANYFTNGEPLTSDTTMNAITSFGFFSLAASMYLKDQDPKSLEKKPRKVKAFFKRLYEKTKGLIPSPNPTPEPVPAGAFSTLENYALAHTFIGDDSPILSYNLNKHPLILTPI